MKMLRTRLRIDSSMADPQEFEDLIDAVGRSGRGDAASQDSAECGRA